MTGKSPRRPAFFTLPGATCSYNVSSAGVPPGGTVMAKAPIKELLFGRLATVGRFVTEEQIAECVALQDKYRERNWQEVFVRDWPKRREELFACAGLVAERLRGGQ